MCKLTSPYEMFLPVVLECDGVDWVKTHNKFKCVCGGGGGGGGGVTVHISSQPTQHPQATQTTHSFHLVSCICDSTDLSVPG